MDIMSIEHFAFNAFLAIGTEDATGSFRGLVFAVRARAFAQNLIKIHVDERWMVHHEKPLSAKF